MRAHRQIDFPPYRLDLDAAVLRAGDRTVSLRPKTWNVLCYLAERPGRLVSKDELLDEVWTNVSVTEATLTKSIGEIRDALNDDVRHPRFVETVHRRGFRFLSGGTDPGTRGEPASPEGSVHLVGRDAELARLRALLDSVSHGTRQTALVSGEAGIGKTTLIEAFLSEIGAIRPARDVLIATGRCMRRHGGEEPLMPVLEALGRLARGPLGSRVVELLRERAPGWLIQLPWLVPAGDLHDLRTKLAGTMPGSMLRVFADVVEELTADVTLVLVFDDLHWADASTVDVVSLLAERQDRARLLVLGTYRPAEAIARGGPFDQLRRVLHVNRRAVDVPIGGLSQSGVEAYLAARFGGHAVPSGLATLLHAQTEGNPLFVVTAVNFLVARGWLESGDDGAVLRTEFETIERHIPGSLQELVELQLLDLDEFQVAVLEAGAVVGMQFGAQAVAAALGVTSDRVEDACQGLVRAQRFLVDADTEAWPDGAVAARYAFAHGVYQRALYHRLPAARCRVLHRKIGERLEAGFGTRAADISAELATHFERGEDPTRAIPWLVRAAASAEDRFAPLETAAYVQRALALQQRLPDGPERSRVELELTSPLVRALIALHGIAADETSAGLMRAYELAAKVGDPQLRRRFALLRLNSSLVRADGEESERLAAEVGRLAEQLGARDGHALAKTMTAFAALFEGRLAQADLSAVITVDPVVGASFAPNPIIWAFASEAMRLWLIGSPDAALSVGHRGIDAARAQANPINLAMTLSVAAHVRLWRGEHARRAGSRAVLRPWSRALVGVGRRHRYDLRGRAGRCVDGARRTPTRARCHAASALLVLRSAYAGHRSRDSFADRGFPGGLDGDRRGARPRANHDVAMVRAGAPQDSR